MDEGTLRQHGACAVGGGELLGGRGRRKNEGKQEEAERDAERGAEHRADEEDGKRAEHGRSLGGVRTPLPATTQIRSRKAVHYISRGQAARSFRPAIDRGGVPGVK